MRFLSLASWLRRYSRTDFVHDLIAGTVTAILLVPQGMAFAILAGLPAQVGLYASIVPPMLYALLGTSRTLAVGPVSVAAIMVAGALNEHGAAGDPTIALALALLSGLILLVMGWLRLGSLVSFLSHPVLSGFTSAAAIVIIGSQLPNLVGLRLTDFRGLGEPLGLVLHPAVLLLGLASMGALLLMGRPSERGLGRWGVPARIAGLIGKIGPLFVVMLATAFALMPGLEDAIAVVGVIPGGLPRLDLGVPNGTGWLDLFPSAALIALVGYVESIAIAKALAHRRRETVSPDRELVALGAANLGAAFTGGMPVAGGFSRTIVNFNAGARTQMAGLITAALVALVALTLTPLLAHIPKVALAAIIVVAVSRLIDFSALREAWRYDRLDALALMATFVGVLILGIELGLLVGIAVSLLAHVWRTRKPHIAVLGRLAGSEHFRNVERHQAETLPELLLVRVDENLNFANAEYLEKELLTRLMAAPEVRHLVLICSAVNHIDVSALAVLEKLVESLHEAGITLHLAEVKGPVMDRLHRTDLLARLAPGRVFASAHLAVAELIGQSSLSAPAREISAPGTTAMGAAPALAT
jgi:sulfate permease, SulP family